jgi:hypothetical protein
MVYVYFCSTWSIVELKTRFETWITRNDVNDVSSFHLSYLINLMAYLYSQRTPNVQIKFLMFDGSIYRLFVLNGGWKRDSFQLMIFECLLVMRHIWTKSAFWDQNNKKWRKWCQFASPFLFQNSYGLPVLTNDFKCPNHVYYVWLVDLQTFVLNRAWKRDSLQIMIFVYVCSTWGVVELKTRFETWKARNDVNGASLSYLS